MGYLDVIPIAWITGKRWDLFREWIKLLPITDRDKKQIIVEYLNMIGWELTVARIKECGVEPGMV